MNNTLFKFYETKASEEAEAYELAVGNFRLVNNGKVLPLGTDLESKEEFERISNLVSSLGPKVLTKKLDGIVGNIGIRASDKLKSIIENDYFINDMAEKVARDLVVKGSAALAIGTDFDGEPYIYRLGGFIARLPNDADIDRSNGVIQITQDDMWNWDVRIFEGSTVRHWTGLRRLSQLDIDNPHNEYENQLDEIVYYGEYHSDDNNVAKGEIEQVSSVLKGIMAVEARIHRISEIFGYPKAVISGNILDVDNSPTSAIVVSEGGKVQYLTPAEFGPLLSQKRDLMSQLNEIATLPNGFIGQGNQPSGEAIREANISYNNSLERYAGVVSRLLTNGFWALAKALRIEDGDVEVTVTPNRVENHEADINLAVELLGKGLLTTEYVVNVIRRKYSGISQEMIDEIIQQYEQVNALVAPEDILGDV